MLSCSELLFYNICGTEKALSVWRGGGLLNKVCELFKEPNTKKIHQQKVVAAALKAVYKFFFAKFLVLGIYLVNLCHYCIQHFSLKRSKYNSFVFYRVHDEPSAWLDKTGTNIINCCNSYHETVPEIQRAIQTLILKTYYESQYMCEVYTFGFKTHATKRWIRNYKASLSKPRLFKGPGLTFPYMFLLLPWRVSVSQYLTSLVQNTEDAAEFHVLTIPTTSWKKEAYNLTINSVFTTRVSGSGLGKYIEILKLRFAIFLFDCLLWSKPNDPSPYSLTHIIVTKLISW